MTNVIPFKRPTPAQKHKGNTLCRNGHNKWTIEAQSVFDVKAGRLVTRFRCERCGATRTKAT